MLFILFPVNYRINCIKRYEKMCTIDFYFCKANVWIFFYPNSGDIFYIGNHIKFANPLILPSACLSGVWYGIR